MNRLVFSFFAALLVFPIQALAQSAGAGGGGSDKAPAPYATFVKDAQVSPGLIGVIRKGGKVYLSFAKTQLGEDFIETSVPSTGLGGYGPAPGEPYVAPARIIHFDRVDDNVILRWPNTYAQVDPKSPAGIGVASSFPNSVIAVAAIAAEDDTHVVIPADAFLGDVANFSAIFDQQFDPQHTYRLDRDRTFFTDAKAFPQNTVLRVSQTWTSNSPNVIDNAPDARALEIRMTYNIIGAPHDGYTPRIADQRVGFFVQPLLNFQTDRNPTRNLYYLTRWNFAPSNPARPSNATNPMVFYLSDDIPTQYRNTVRSALLKWNSAFSRIGILNAVQVQQQPADPSWDPDDIRHNIVRWISTAIPQYGAEALIISDPRTGEELNVGINVDAVEGMAGRRYRYVIAPARGIPDTAGGENQYTLQALVATVLHEAGHDMGLQHNFIGSTAYTAAQLQSRAFTSRYGIANSVMEYAPVNLWPKGTRNGDYEQQVLGPYDYYAMRYGYGYIPNARTPEQELPTLRRWASEWTNPWYRFASDEDVDFGSGHAIDPRVAMDDLSNYPLRWCNTQLTMLHGIMNAVDRRFPMSGQSYEDARRAFTLPLGSYIVCATIPAHTIGGEYLSRATSAETRMAPLQAVPRSQEYAAWQLLNRALFSDAAWNFSPAVLSRLTYDEVAPFTSALWAYNPAPRHDVPVVERAAQAQDAALNEVFAPLTMERIDDLFTKYKPGTTMSLSDLFDWAHSGIYGEIPAGRNGRDGVVRRSLQMRFAKRLAQMWTAPAPGTPPDAQALARFELGRIAGDTRAALARGRMDELTRAHLEALQTVAKQALDARATIAAPPAPQPQ